MPCRSSRGQKPTTARGNRFSRYGRNGGALDDGPAATGIVGGLVPGVYQATTYPEKCSIDQLNCFERSGDALITSEGLLPSWPTRSDRSTKAGDQGVGGSRRQFVDDRSCRLQGFRERGPVRTELVRDERPLALLP
jgi:hypothetical protein